MKKCTSCKKNVAIISTTKIENGKTEQMDLCIDCAQKMGIPIADEIMNQVNLSNEDVENLSKQMSQLFENMGTDGFDEENFFMKMSGMDFSEDKEDLPSNDGFEIEEIEIEEGVLSSEDGETESKRTFKKNKKSNSFKTLNKYGSDLIEKAKAGEIDRIVGRNREIDRVVQILNRRSKNNPVLIGEPGVGKTAIAEGLAVRIVEKEVPEKLLNTKVFLLDMTSVVAGTQFRGQFEGRMKSIIKEASSSGDVVLVIDEVHNIMGAGEVHGGVMNAANILKPALAKGDVQIIGATTLDEYRKHIEKDSALERRFQPVVVDEPSVDESIEILKGIKDYYEQYHRVNISDEVIESAVKLSKRYITDRYLPDKAIDIIDEAGSRANLKNKGLVELQALKDELSRVIDEKEQASMMEDYEKAADLRVTELNLMDEISAVEEKSVEVHLTTEDVAFVIESWTKIPVRSIKEDEAIKLIDLENRLHRRVIGQERAVEVISKAVRRNRSGFSKKKKPSSFIFVGPTGVGKTELARALSETLFGTEDAMIRIDMSEYMEKHTVSKLIGAPPGYVGFDEGGQLTERVRRRPYSVILFDEIEKAHNDVFNMMLQILEDGRLTDGQGRTVFFENTIIIMTSNAGTNHHNNNIGFGSDQYEVIESQIHTVLKETFRPEFLNRIDDIVVFDKLSKEEIREIIDLQLKEIVSEVEDKSMTIEVTDEVKALILEKGYDEKYGARPIRRTIQKELEDEIAELYIRKLIKSGDLLRAVIDQKKVKILY